MDNLIVPRPTGRLTHKPTHRPTVLVLREPDRPYVVRRPGFHNRPVRPSVATSPPAPPPAKGFPPAAGWVGRASEPTGRSVTPRPPEPPEQPQPTASVAASEAALPTATTPAPPPRLLDRLRSVLRARHYSLKTEAAYLSWTRQFIRHHGLRHPASMGKAEVEAFLTHLAEQRGVAAATQNQALAALLFLYREVLASPLPWLDEVVRAKRPKKLPVVLSTAEVDRLLAGVHGQVGLFLRLLYGTGMRIGEAAKLRVMDIDFDRREVTVRRGKGAKDRVTLLLATKLRLHISATSLQTSI